MTVLTRSSHSLPSLSGEPDCRFFRPPLPAGHVPRPRLCERLAQGLQGRLLLISAPAGFGKSSLASEFCEGLPAHWRSLWLGLSPRAGDPGRFFEYLLEGLRQSYPGLGDEALVLLKLRQHHQPFAFEAWLAGLLDELATRLSAEQPLLLVLDDYHLAQGPVLDGCLQYVISHMPAGLLLLVTSRQRPDWHLARLRLTQQLPDPRRSPHAADRAGRGASRRIRGRAVALRRLGGRPALVAAGPPGGRRGPRAPDAACRRVDP